MTVRASLVALFAAVFAACGCPGVRVRVVSPSGESRLAVCAVEASTAASRERGLRGSAALGPAEGLWMTWPQPVSPCLVNDGVAFDVDAVLVDAARTVVAVQPLAANDPTPRCHDRVQYVLELAGGTASGILPGDRVP